MRSLVTHLAFSSILWRSQHQLRTVPKCWYHYSHLITIYSYFLTNPPFFSHKKTIGCPVSSSTLSQVLTPRILLAVESFEEKKKKKCFFFSSLLFKVPFSSHILPQSYSSWFFRFYLFNRGNEVTRWFPRCMRNYNWCSSVVTQFLKTRIPMYPPMYLSRCTY